MITRVNKCRICKHRKFDEILSLGKQALTGVFPKNSFKKILYAPLELIRCQRCGLVQLRDSVKRELMYGESYGYRSGINQTMVQHLYDIADEAQKRVELEPWDAVIDIGSNDCTLLHMYNPELNRIGIDPLGKKFWEYYTHNIKIIPQYFSAKMLPKAKIITSIAMFYDLEDPMEFMREVKKTLHPDGVWVTEQSYMPTMVKRTAYDVICHEHLEYYGLRQIKWMTDKLRLVIIDVSLNECNGGSFRVTIAKNGIEATKKIDALLKREESINFGAFAKRVDKHRTDLKMFLHKIVHEDKQTIMGYGASTKGNVILQYCGIGQYLRAVADRNPEKYGKVTPGTNVLIIPESRMRIQKPDYLLVLPYHFKEGFLSREQKFIADGGKMIFPLPKLTVYPC